MTLPTPGRRALLGAASAGLLAAPSLAQERTLRIGYQKYGTLVLLKGRGSLDARLRGEGVRATWTEFPSGPALLEAMNVGAIDLGTVGEAPPVFAQAAGATVLYVAHEPPAPRGEAILVQRDSPIRSVAELRGKKVAFNKGSNVHYLLVRALEAAGLRYADIEPATLPPADARVAFERRQVDAWVIWDPFLAAAEATTGARQLADGTGLVSNHQFYMAAERFTAANGPLVDAVVAALADTAAWVSQDIPAAARTLSPGVGIPAPILEVAMRRQAYGVRPLDAAVAAEQQRIADTFLGLGLIPRAIRVSDAVR
jgi:sulfonate transport system substrate-binding protein